MNNRLVMLMMRSVNRRRVLQLAGGSIAATMLSDSIARALAIPANRAAGDTGAFACIRSDGTTIANVLDPPSQPWVTSVGGTSLTHFNPGQNPFPSYPANGAETVWNVDGLCNQSGDEGG